jgi:serine/threonine protein kinase
MSIGTGGFASVFRARQPGLDRWVAVKIILEKNRAKRKALLREAKVQAQISLDNIPHVYDAFEWGPRVCIIMEWIRGVPLSTILDCPLPQPDRQYLAKGFIEALAGLHAQGFAHRDLKPENILVSPGHGLYLVDFGLSKNIIDGQKSVILAAKGTPAYMAPEIWKYGSNVDLFRADVFSAGKVLGQILGNETAVPFMKQLLDYEPKNRPASGKEVLALWRSLPDAATDPADCWVRLAASITSQQLSQSLARSAKQLLYAGRNDEAYWLLVEALEENADNAEAVRWMTDFSRLSKKPGFNNGIPYAAAVAGGVIASLFAFYIGKQSGEMIGSDPILETGRHTSRQHITSMSIGNALHKGEHEILLKEDSLKSDRLSGRLIVAPPRTNGIFLIDAVPVENGKLSGSGIDLEYGHHTLSWNDSNGVRHWRERVNMLPFQTIAVQIRHRLNRQAIQ